MDVIEKLLALQDRDQRIRTFRTEFTQIPEERKNREKQIADSAARLELAKTRLKEIEVNKNALELEIKTKNDSIIRYKQQQLQTRKNEEFSALNHEIEAAEKTISGLEDRELELMEEADGLKPEISAAEQTHSAEKAKIEQILNDLDAKKGHLESRIAELQGSRDQMATDIDEDVLDRYNRLFKTKNGAAVAPLEHEVCMGCHMKVTTQTIVAVKTGKEIIHCPQCGRILYFPA